MTEAFQYLSGLASESDLHVFLDGDITAFQQNAELPRQGFTLISQHKEEHI